jgi:hypothetical protein
MDPLSGRRLRDVTLSDIDRLVAGAVPESLHIDYKEKLHLNTRDEKKEFLRDVTAFANAEGGLLIYGIEEDRDSGGKPTGIPVSASGTTLENRDGDVLSIEHLLRDGIDERLPSYELQKLPVSGNEHVVLIRVPASLRSPHMVVLGGERRFYVRMNGGKQDMSTAQLRDAVLKTQSLEERIRSFIEDRVARLSKMSGSYAFSVLHLIPVLRSPTALDVTEEKTIDILKEALPVGGGYLQHCLEGYKSYDYPSDGRKRHALAFRDGSIEFFDQSFFELQDSRRCFAYQYFHEAIASFVGKGLSVYQSGLLAPPLAVCLTLAGLRGYRLPVHFLQRPAIRSSEPITSEPVVVSDLNTDPHSTLKPFMDVLWNAFGQPRCPAYDDEGNYIDYPR